MFDVFVCEGCDLWIDKPSSFRRPVCPVCGGVLLAYSLERFFDRVRLGGFVFHGDGV